MVVLQSCSDTDISVFSPLMDAVTHTTKEPMDLVVEKGHPALSLNLFKTLIGMAILCEP